MKRLALLVAAAALIAGPALAGTPVTLRPDTMASGKVTLGDLFNGAGKAAGLVVATAAQPGSSVVLDAGQVQKIARGAGLDWDNASGIRRIIVRGGVSAAEVQPGAKAQAAKTVEVLTYARNINAGDIVRAEDIEWGEVAAFAAPNDAPRDADAVIGKAAKKPLRAGAAVAARDLSMPQVIKKDDMVQVTYAVPGVKLSLQAKALEAAAVGDSISLMNLTAKKTIEAVVTGPGRAVVGPEADRIRDAMHPTTLALR